MYYKVVEKIMLVNICCEGLYYVNSGKFIKVKGEFFVLECIVRVFLGVGIECIVMKVIR